MNKKFYLIAGLPRSGSTLLSSILSQNPKFYATASTPIHLFFDQMIQKINMFPYHRHSMTENKMKVMLEGLFTNFYSDVQKPICFDTNRCWTNVFHMVKVVFPDIKIICCVRGMDEIISSYERMYHKNAFIYPSAYSTNMFNEFDDVYKRSRRLKSQLLSNYYSLREMYFGKNRNDAFFIDYDSLCYKPEITIRNLYDFLGEQEFNHNFNNVGVSYDYMDELLNMPTLHTVEEKLRAPRKEQILPPDLQEESKLPKFWIENR